MDQDTRYEVPTVKHPRNKYVKRSTQDFQSSYIARYTAVKQGIEYGDQTRGKTTNQTKQKQTQETNH